MTDISAAPVELTATPGAAPAAPPTATPTEPDKTPDQLAADQKAADEAKKAEDEEKADEERVKRKPWFQKRIDEQTRKYHDENRRAARLEESLQQALNVIARAQQQQAPPKPEQPPQPLPATRPAPTREQFEFDEEKYLNAVVDWRIEQTEAKRAHDSRQAEMRRGQETFANDIETRRAAALKTGAEKYPDFDQVVNAMPANVMNAELAIAVLETDSPADVAYHLGKNPAEAERISKLPPLKKALALGKLEATMSATTKTTTKAPPPPTPVDGKGTINTDPDKLPMKDYYKAYLAGKR